MRGSGVVAALRKAVLLTHRWLGIAGCVLFVAWFVSGIVMMYARMPQLLPEEKLARAARLDLKDVAVTPAMAAESWGPNTAQVRVSMLGGRPVYRFGGRDQLVIYADNGEVFTGLTSDEAMTAARAFVPDSASGVRYDTYLEEPDQWTIGMTYFLPMHRIVVDDDAGTRLYVSDITGDVELRTTARERFWAYLGPVTHWVYFLPFRRMGSYWYQFVVWSSLIGCVMCASGLVWGMLRFSRRGFRMRGRVQPSPYTGLMLWHHYAGLIFGAVALTWAYSGLLSMEPFDWFPRSGLTEAQRLAVSGGATRLDLLTVESMRAAAEALGTPAEPVRELEVVQFLGEPFWAAERVPSLADVGRWMYAGLLPRAALPRLERRYVSAEHPEHGPMTTFDRGRMREVAGAAMPGVAVTDAVWLDAYDGYYYDPRGTRPLPVLRVRYEDPALTWLYFDPQRGSIAQMSDKVSRTRRWLYQGLHSLDFPFLYFKRPLWDVVVIVLSIGGLLSSGTALLPAWRRVMRYLRALASAPKDAVTPLLQRLRQ